MSVLGLGPGLFGHVVSVLVSRGYLAEATQCAQKVSDALLKLQRWAGLDLTGEMDRETLAELDAPRFCGLPDAMPLYATQCKWPDGDVAYYVYDAFPGLSMAQTLAAFAWAARLWTGSANLRMGVASDPARARIVARVKRLDGPSGVLAQSQLPCGSIRQAAQDYDSSEAWDKQIQARLVIAHEVGHALGLDHAPGKGSLMSPYYDPAITSLQQWDIAQIQQRYGAATGPQPQPPSPNPPSGGKVLVDYGRNVVTAPTGWKIEVSDG